MISISEAKSNDISESEFNRIVSDFEADRDEKEFLS